MREALPGLAGVLLATVVAGVVGCSFTFVKGPPPPNRAPKDPDCSNHYLFPVIDAALAVVGGYFIYRALSPADDETGRPGEPSPRNAVLGIGVLSLFGASSAWGAINVRDCREAYASAAGPRRGPRRTSRADEYAEEQAAQARARELAAEKANAAATAPTPPDASAPDASP